MKGSRRQPFWPDPALPPQVKEEEGRRQGCARAVLRPSQIGEAAACRARGSCCRRRPRPPGETERPRATGLAGACSFGVPKGLCRQCHLEQETRPPEDGDQALPGWRWESSLFPTLWSPPRFPFQLWLKTQNHDSNKKPLTSHV